MEEVLQLVFDEGVAGADVVTRDTSAVGSVEGEVDPFVEGLFATRTLHAFITGEEFIHTHDLSSATMSEFEAPSLISALEGGVTDGKTSSSGHVELAVHLVPSGGMAVDEVDVALVDGTSFGALGEVRIKFETIAARSLGVDGSFVSRLGDGREACETKTAFRDGEVHEGAEDLMSLLSVESSDVSV